MGLRNTYRPKFGPFTLNFNKGFGLSSATIRLFGVTYRLWSKKQKSGFASVDLPGPLSYRPKASNKARKNKPADTETQEQHSA